MESMFISSVSPMASSGYGACGRTELSDFLDLRTSRIRRIYTFHNRLLPGRAAFHFTRRQVVAIIHGLMKRPAI
jgi:hypothetical protein